MSLGVAELVNVSKLEMVAGKDAELALVLAVVAALLIPLVVVPACEILFPHFGKKKDFLKAYSYTFHRRQPLPNTHRTTKRSGKLLSLDPGRGIYFCTGTYISVLEHIFLYWNCNSVLE